MNYYELLFTTITTEDYHQDLLINALAEIGFDTFEEVDFGFKAYIASSEFDKEILEKTLSLFNQDFQFTYDITLIPQINWNAVWESNFEPITIGNSILVRATFHQPNPNYPYEIIIDPKMAFGTGHHQTTSMMLSFMLETNFQDKQVLDMGCGTGILAIMASKLGATAITAIDNDKVCFESTIENALINNITNIEAICGSKEAIPEKKYDIILANINRNILLDQIATYNNIIECNAEIFLSGFYENPDLSIIIEAAKMYNLIYITHKIDKDWVAVKLIKN